MPYGMTSAEYQTLLEERNREVGDWYRKNATHEPKITARVSQSYKGPERKQKLLESTKETRKELVKVSKPYHIGTLLPEAKRAFHNLPLGLQESITGEKLTITEAKKQASKGLGSLLPEAKQAYHSLLEG